LTNAELLAILLRSGVKGSSAVDLGRKLITKFNTFRNMNHTDISQWKELLLPIHKEKNTRANISVKGAECF